MYKTTRPLTSLSCPGRDPGSDDQRHGWCRPLLQREEQWRLGLSRFPSFRWTTWVFVLEVFLKKNFEAMYYVLIIDLILKITKLGVAGGLVMSVCIQHLGFDSKQLHFPYVVKANYFC